MGRALALIDGDHGTTNRSATPTREVERERHDRRQQDRAEDEVGPEAVLRQLHPDAEPVRRADVLPEDRADDRVDDADPQAREQRRQGRRPAQRRGRSAALVAPNDRSSVVASGSTRPNPSSSATVTGKNVTSTTMTTLGSSPNPNQMTNSGAIATIGIVWLVTRSGSTARRTGASGRARWPSGSRGRPTRHSPSAPRRASGRGGRRRPRGTSHSAPTTRRRRGQHDRVEAGEPDVGLPDEDERRDQDERRSPAADDARARRHGR